MRSYSLMRPVGALANQLLETQQPIYAPLVFFVKPDSLSLTAHFLPIVLTFLPSWPIVSLPHPIPHLLKDVATRFLDAVVDVLLQTVEAQTDALVCPWRQLQLIGHIPVFTAQHERDSKLQQRCLHACIHRRLHGCFKALGGATQRRQEKCQQRIEIADSTLHRCARHAPLVFCCQQTMVNREGEKETKGERNGSYHTDAR